MQTYCKFRPPLDLMIWWDHSQTTPWTFEVVSVNGAYIILDAIIKTEPVKIRKEELKLQTFEETNN